MQNEDLIHELRAFVKERDWQQFHTLENLAKSVSIEAGELLECFQWNSTPDSEALQDELADVLTYCMLLADKLNLEPAALVRNKLAKTKAKYPIEKSRGSSAKYDKF